MAHNFRLHLSLPVNSCAFVSKAGNDSNDGMTPDTPRLTMAAGRQAAANNNRSNIIVGTGTYAETGTSGAQWGGYWQADGYVTVRLPDFLSTDDTPFMTGFNFVPTNTRTTWNRGGGGGMSFQTCTFDRVDITGDDDGSFNNKFLYTDCTFTDCTGNNRARIHMLRCVVARGNFSWIHQFAYSYLSADSQAVFAPGAGPDRSLTGPEYDFNNIQGQIAPGTLDGRYRMVAGAFGPLADFRVAFPSAVANCINLTPYFNKPAANDYTLQLASSHLDLGIGPSHLRYALMYYVDFSGSVGDLCTLQNTRIRSSADGGIINFLEIGGFTVNEQGGLVIVPNSSGNFEAYFTTDRIRLASNSQPVERLPFIFAANYDTNFPSSEAAFNAALPEVYNNNVPAYRTFGGGNAGRNPRRLTIQARHSPNLNPDVTNSGDWILGSWIDYEINRKPTYNITGAIGNGHPDYDLTPTNVTQMVGRWAQLRARFRNNYYSRAI